ncbi:MULTISPECIES: hypothetical protein [unclassified Pseudomonas]|uniref:hypothetical protein n=1 Tax=unclassified Pseudomonas TaxID=196821 RepID=UPI001784646D|nr:MULTISPECIES: hypothetical protein [unclassified Pseudomonas]MBD8591994.1 hypothetical protein [Pseudomonas sp. CFBP 8758]MBD8733479.1 hypothetical protein [Pseudomonas sp. CFBP 13710]
MRVPIYPFDLERNRRFKRIANTLRSNWPIIDGLSLMVAHEVLASGLGYRDFHDLLKSSKTCLPDAPVPSLAEVRDSVSTAIYLHAKLHEIAEIDDGAINSLVMALPLHELLAFKSFRMKQESSASSAPARSQPDLLDFEVSRAPNRSLLITPLSQEDLKALAEAVDRITSLRDRALCVAALSGIRQVELLHLKAGYIQGDGLVFDGFKASISIPKRMTYRLPALSTAVLSQYVEESGLSDGDYLFTSHKNPNHPMTQFELKRILRAWWLEAQIDPQSVSIRALREAFIMCAIAHRSVPTRDALAAAMGHPWPGLLSQYIRGIDRTPKA